MDLLLVGFGVLSITELHFEQAGKSYSRRVTYQENEHQNHYLAIKSLPSQTAKCHVTIRLRELPPLAKRKTQDRDVMNSRLDDREDRRVRFQDDMPREPRDMSRDPRDMSRDPRDMPREPRDMSRDPRDMSRDPRDMPRETRDMSREPRDMPREPRETRNTPRSFPSELEPSVKKELSDQLEELYQQEDYVDNVEHDDNAKKPQLKHQNPYYLVGIICVALFVLMLSYKFLRKK